MAKRFPSNAVAGEGGSLELSFLLAAILAVDLQAADNIGVLGSKPRWEVLERYQQTITHDEFRT